MVPVTESITASSVGGISNAKVPPTRPVILAVAPSQAGVIVKEESSAGLI